MYHLPLFSPHTKIANPGLEQCLIYYRWPIHMGPRNFLKGKKKIQQKKNFSRPRHRQHLTRNALLCEKLSTSLGRGPWTSPRFSALLLTQCNYMRSRTQCLHSQQVFQLIHTQRNAKWTAEKMIGKIKHRFLNKPENSLIKLKIGSWHPKACLFSV